MSVDGTRVPVTLHLDSRALEVRGGVRRNIPRTEIAEAVADGTTLTVSTPGEHLVVDLGAPAAPWAKALLTAPPTLAEKLGLGGGGLAFVVGDAPPEIVAALGGTTTDIASAVVVVATVRTAIELDGLPGLLAALGLAVPVWVVHGKGRVAAPGEGPVRATMRAAGYRDTKVSAVSDEWSTTRYSR